ncbi:MAG: helix-turn-helix transcriptional regulator [Lachnospiraceae bacterium]|nr:helix-turn-helix transcriptional regulator [Lachnospiraceae bacterium]
MEIGNKLRNARNEKGITQEQAAELLGVSRQTISNWENNKSYPDIISVIKMSDFYAVSLDILLKEDKEMNQTYQEFLKESTDTVKAKNNLVKIIILVTYLIIWFATMIIFWTAGPGITMGFNIVLKFIAMPVMLLTLTLVYASNNYWGNAVWFLIPIGMLTFLAIPHVQNTMDISQGTLTLQFRFPNISYMAVGAVVSVCGLLIGAGIRKFGMKKKKD